MAVINPAAQGRIGATNLVQGQQAPVRVEGITPSAFGAVDNPLGGALERLGGAFEYAQQRQDAVDRTAAYAKMDEYQTGLHTTLDQLYRNTDPATSNYYETARGVIDNASQEFIAKNIPANLQDEFKARVSSIAEAAKRQSYEDGRKQEDSFFDQSITNAITRAGNGFESGGWTREQADSYVDERIAATDLPPEERLKRRYAAHLQIAKMDYGRSIKAELSAGNVSGADLIRSFEGFRANAYMDHDARTHEPAGFRAGYGSDYVVRADGTREKVTADTVVSQADGERTLQYRLANEFEPKVRDQVGSEAWGSLPASARAALLSVAWNYGDLPSSVADAVKTHDIQGIANAVESLDANPARRAEEAKVIRGATGAYQRASFADVQVEKDSGGRWFTPNIGYELAGKTRDLPLSRDYVQTVGGVLRGIDPKLGAVIISAAQEGTGPHRTGSHRHDVGPDGLGRTSDFVLVIGGKRVTPSQAPELYAHVIEEMAAAGFTGIGHYPWGIHVGGGKPAFWGPSTTSRDADTTLQAAYQRGRDRANAGVDGDPRFAIVPYEDRVAITQDAQAELHRDAATQAAADKAANEAYMNDLQVGIRQGTVGRDRVETEIGAGKITDYGDMVKLDEALKKYQGEQDSAAQGWAKYGKGDPFDPGSEEDRKSLNAMFGDRGKDAITGMNQEYFTRQLLPMAQGTGDIPTDLAGLLTGMARSQDPQKVKFAMQALGQLEAAAPAAYASRVGEKLRQDVTFFNQHAESANTGETLADLVRQTNGGVTPQQRSAQAEMRKVGNQLLSGKSEYNLDAESILNEFSGSIPFFRNTPVFAGEGWMTQGMIGDYQNLFLDYFEKSGNADTAKANALKALHLQYDTFDVGGIHQLLKYAPSRAGYAPINGSYDWIGESLRAELGANPRWPSASTIGALNLTPEEQHLYQHHLDNLNNKKYVRNPDGSTSTLYQVSVEVGGRTYNVPSVWDGKILSEHDAVQRAFTEKGKDYWPSYVSESEAEARYSVMHDVLASDIGAIAAHERGPQLGPDDKFALASDSQTVKEYQDHVADPSKPLPSYMIVKQSADGEYSLIPDETGVPVRKRFEPLPATKALGDLNFDSAQARLNAARVLDEVDRARKHNGLTGTPVPQDLLDEAKAASDKVKELNARQPGIVVPPARAQRGAYVR